MSGAINIIVGGRVSGNTNELPVEAYNVDTGVWVEVGKLGRFRHSSWIHDNILCVLGGFEYSKPTFAISKQMAPNLSEFIEEKRKENA